MSCEQEKHKHKAKNETTNKRDNQKHYMQDRPICAKMPIYNINKYAMSQVGVN